MASTSHSTAASTSPSTPANPLPRASRLCRSDRDRLARRLSIALTLAGWSGGMLGRALEVTPAYARRLRLGDRNLTTEQIGKLRAFPRLADALDRVGLLDKQKAGGLYAVDGGAWTGTLDDFFAANDETINGDDAAELRAALEALKLGETYEGAGGAAAMFTITRVAVHS